jgi:short-subunit dehydrogenase
LAHFFNTKITSILYHQTNSMVINQTALITGAGSGIGYELAKLLSKDGLRLIIVSGNEEELSKAAVEFKQLGSPDVIAIKKDLSIPGASADIYACTKHHNIHVDLLINDSGVQEFKSSSEIEMKKKLILTQLNIASMVYLYLNDMLPENKGHILQLASVTLHQPALYMAAYTESKAFILSFTNALIDELRNTDVTVTGIIPDYNNKPVLNIGRKNAEGISGNENPALLAKAGYNALMKGLNYTTGPGICSKVILSNTLLN